MSMWRRIQEKISDLFWDIGSCLPAVPAGVALIIATISLIVAMNR